MTSSRNIIIDSEAFIMEVKSWPAIWDTGDECYSNRIDKHNAWEEVCRVFVTDYDRKTESEKNLIVNELQKKWKHLRNCFTRELNKQQKTQKRGSGAEWRRRYKYFDLLAFLIPFCSTRPNTTTVAGSDDEVPGKRVIITMVQDDKHKAGKKKKFTPEPVRPEPSLSFKELSESIKHRSKEEYEDPDRQFLLSLLPDFKAIPQNVKIDAKFEIMSILHKYNRPQGLPQYYSAANPVPQYTTVDEEPQYSTTETSSNFEFTDVKFEAVPSPLTSKSEQPVPSPGMSD